MSTGINDKENVNKLNQLYKLQYRYIYTSIIRLNNNLTECQYEDQIQSNFYESNAKITHTYPIYPILIRSIIILIPELTRN